ncbi:hypothetical protein AB0H83_20975 [Dactylosporangium sp. NPDC050688]|uniref:hypothetical protein n=1 Tax=Dactylosporangium sp. NPDC050688 TaxID=3157217 RepID=UPI0033D11CBD
MTTIGPTPRCPHHPSRSARPRPTRSCRSRWGRRRPVLAQLGVPPQRLDQLAMLFVDLLRANPPGVVVRRDQEEAWATTGRLVSRWLADRAATAAHEPATWSAPVAVHERRGAEAAVVSVRTYLPCTPTCPGSSRWSSRRGCPDGGGAAGSATCRPPGTWWSCT